MGSVDTVYLNAQATDRKKRGAVGTYRESGLSQYQVANNTGANDTNLAYPNGSYFPANWDPRYTLFQGLGANPDHRENYQVHKAGPRVPAINITGFPVMDYYVSYKDAVTGFLINGTLPVSADQGVHVSFLSLHSVHSMLQNGVFANYYAAKSLTDVPVYAKGPCQELFGGTYNNVDVFYGMAECLGLSKPKTGGY